MATLQTLKARGKRKGVKVSRQSGGGPFTLTDLRTGDVIRTDLGDEIDLEEAINWLDEPGALEPEDTYDIAATRRALLADNMRVATPKEGTEFKGAICQCGRVVQREGRYWTHLDTGLVECD